MICALNCSISVVLKSQYGQSVVVVAVGSELVSAVEDNNGKFFAKS